MERKIRLQVIIFCQNVKTLRKQNGLTQKEMAEKLGIGVKSLSLMENGIVPKRLSTEVIYKVSNCFDVSASVLLSTVL